jgi:transcriptional regulator with XRE-family HTH domain
MSRTKNAQKFVAAVGQRVKTERDRLGLTQEQLASRLRVWVPQVSLLENGKRNIRLSDLYGVAVALETKPAALVDVEIPDASAPQPKQRPSKH